MAPYSCLTGGCGQGVGLCSQGRSDRSRGNGLELRQGRVRVGVRGHFCPGRVVRHRHRLPGEGAPALGAFKKCVDAALGDRV